MATTFLAVFWQSLTAATSRRGVLAGLGGGLLAAGPLAFTRDLATARKKRKRRKKRKNKRDKKPKTRITATCPGSEQFGFGAADGNARVAQTFTATTSGPLVKAQFSNGKDEGSGGDYVLRLSPVDGAGFPTNKVLAEAILANASVPAGGSTIAFTFGDPASVVAGETYALVLTRPGGGATSWGVEVDDPCGGQAFFSPDQTAPFDPGLGGNDLTFTAFVRS